jgi:hypothetical protein
VRKHRAERLRKGRFYSGGSALHRRDVVDARRPPLALGRRGRHSFRRLFAHPRPLAAALLSALVDVAALLAERSAHARFAIPVLVPVALAAAPAVHEVLELSFDDDGSASWPFSVKVKRCVWVSLRGQEGQDSEKASRDGRHDEAITAWEAEQEAREEEAAIRAAQGAAAAERAAASRAAAASAPAAAEDTLE